MSIELELQLSYASLEAKQKDQYFSKALTRAGSAFRDMLN